MICTFCASKTAQLQTKRDILRGAQRRLNILWVEKRNGNEGSHIAGKKEGKSVNMEMEIDVLMLGEKKEKKKKKGQKEKWKWRFLYCGKEPIYEVWRRAKRTVGSRVKDNIASKPKPHKTSKPKIILSKMMLSKIMLSMIILSKTISTPPPHKPHNAHSQKVLLGILTPKIIPIGPNFDK